MSIYRYIAFAIAVVSTAAMLYVGLYQSMMNFGGYCFYCLTTAFLSPVLLWTVWKLG